MHKTCIIKEKAVKMKICSVTFVSFVSFSLKLTILTILTCGFSPLFISGVLCSRVPRARAPVSFVFVFCAVWQTASFVHCTCTLRPFRPD